ncbi:MAG: FAD-dependent oxidoreductase [Acidobacteriota bacterium]
MRDPGHVVILGAGPTGLGVATRLHELGLPFTLLEAREGPGGLAASDVDAKGFTWDVGGHVQFSHYAYYDDLLDRALGDAWLWHERESWIWMRGRFIPYPFQNNLHRLDPEDRDRALQGLERAAASRPARRAETFRQWILDTFGEELAEIFLLPYNEKVWGHDLDRIGTSWMGDRVAVPDVARIRENVSRDRDDISWGPNRRFRFPLRGGTGEIWRRVAALLPEDRLRYRTPVARIDLSGRRVMTASGEEIGYDALCSSLPLDVLCGMCRGLDDGARRAAGELVRSACHILGVGLRGERPAALATKCWMYFPEPHSPYYRVTVFSNYSPHNVPDGDHWSLMAEVCETATRPVDAGSLLDETIAAMRRDGLVDGASEVVSRWHRREEHGYPTPFVGRDRVLSRIRPALETHGVYARGRFGAWLYEVSNQDHSFMQGVELVDRLTGAGDEPTIRRPDAVNAGLFARR